MAARPVLGIDIGGTKLVVGLVDPVTGEALVTQRSDTPAHLGGEEVYRTTVDLCRRLPGLDGIEAIGVCFGGQVYKNYVLRSNQVEGWDDFPLEERLKADIAPVPVRIVNDANAIAWLEWTKRVNPEMRSLFYVTVSTGIGGGFVFDNKIIEGRHGLASEIGHMVLKADGPICGCGLKGCVEALAAGPAITREYAVLTERDLPAKEIALAAAEGEEVAAQVIQHSGAYIGQALALMNTLLDVDLIVLGGGVSRSGDLWFSAILEQFQAFTPPWGSVPQIELSTLGEVEGVLAGAAATHNMIMS